MKIALIGYGKMGRAIDQLAQAEGDEIVLRVDDDASVAPLDEQSRRRALSKSLVAAFSKQLGGVLAEAERLQLEYLNSVSLADVVPTKRQLTKAEIPS